jgi:hypothetical protein
VPVIPFMIRMPDPTRPRVLPLITAVVLLLPGAALDAQTGPPSNSAAHADAPTATAVRAEGSIVIDGRLTEAVWSTAPAITEFTQVDPTEGAPASQRTEVRIAYDDNALYVAAWMYDTGEIRSRLARRDASLGESDFFQITLDSYHDHQTAYRFATNPSGMKRDALLSGGSTDGSWDPVWDLATQRAEGLWTVEMRIPFSQLRFSRDDAQVWGIQVERMIHRNQEHAQFAFTPKLERGGVQRFGHLHGIERIVPGRRVELLPYATARSEHVRPPTSTVAPGLVNPFRSDVERVAGAGLDLKFRVDSNITLDATFNPDFGQVEVDPAVINLTAFETRFQERRPFFVEGAEIFRFGEGGPTGSTGRPAEVLYSRRMGRAPQGLMPAQAAFSDVPNATTIVGAAKLTGKLPGGWSVGLLNAVTSREDAPYVDASGTRGEAQVEPAANYLVGRVRRDIRGGATRFGAILTAVNRDLSDEALARRLHASAYTAGVDLIHEWGGRSWRLSASLSPSLVTGQSAALLRTQQTSSRYLNRPDADHLQVDSAATRLTGYYAMAELNKQAGAWTGRLGLGATSAGYEVNDVGFQSYADRLIVDTHLQYNQLRPGRYLRNWSVSGGPDNIWNYAGEHVMSNINIQGRYQWTNYWGSGWRVEITPEVYDDRFTRGGPMALSPRGILTRFDVNTDSRRPQSVRAQVSFFDDRGGSWSRSGGIDLSYRPRESWSVAIGPNVSRSHSAAQYVTAVTDARATSTFGRRYVFAELDQTTFSVDTRLNVTFTPTLSFEMYAQPFLSSGDYGPPAELKAPRTFDFLQYGRDVGSIQREPDGAWRVDPVGNEPARSFRVRDSDFTFRSLVGNAVLRWEWRAGSTLYLVWQQSREERLTALALDPASRVGRVGGHDARELFGLRPDNIFAVKVNYWINP